MDITIAMWILVLELFEASGTTPYLFHKSKYREFCEQHGCHYYSYPSFKAYLDKVCAERDRQQILVQT